MGDTLPARESLPEDPVNTRPNMTAISNKKRHKRKGKSKTRSRSKSAHAASSASETSPGCANRIPSPKVDLVIQDLQLSSDRSDSENPEGANNMAGGSSPMEEMAWVESWTQPPPETPLHPPEETVPDHPLDRVPMDPLAEVATEPVPEETVDAGQQPVETMNPVPSQVVPNPTIG